jgi:hypothetical protein
VARLTAAIDAPLVLVSVASGDGHGGAGDGHVVTGATNVSLTVGVGAASVMLPVMVGMVPESMVARQPTEENQ